MELTPELKTCLKIANNAGSPIDQVKTFLELEYVPLPWQWEFHAAARQADIRCQFHLDNPKTKKKGKQYTTIMTFDVKPLEKFLSKFNDEGDQGFQS